MSSSITIERKRVDCNSLPKGWQREEVLRKSGISAGKVDVFYYSPTGRKIESKPQLARCLGDAIDIGSFDFQSGKFVRHLPPPSISLFRCSGVSGGGSNSGGISASGSLGSGSSSSGSTAMLPPQNNGIVGGNSANSPCSPWYPSQSSSAMNVNNNMPTNSITTTPNALKRKYKAQSQSQTPSQSQSQTQLQGMPINATGSSCAPTSVCGATASSSANSRQQLEISRSPRTDVPLVPPIRQTASIFKQPVTVVRNHENGKVRQDNKSSSGQEKPKQMFWEKRLEGLRACHDSGEEFEEIVLPKCLRTCGPNINEQTVLQSLATALHVLNVPVMGQTSTKTEMNKNATAFLNPEQPLMQAVLVSDDDIRKQEERVNAARRKLQDALKA